MGKAYIYLMWFPGTSYYYIGSTGQYPKRRFTKHLQELKNGIHHNIIASRCYEKYGLPDFMVLEEVDSSSKFIIEQEYLDLFGMDPFCMNLNLKANSAFSGLPKERYPVLPTIKNVITGEVVENFQGSISLLALKLGIDQFHLGDVLRGKLKSTGNWVLMSSSYTPTNSKHYGKKITKEGQIVMITNINKTAKEIGMSGPHLNDLVLGNRDLSCGWSRCGF